MSLAHRDRLKPKQSSLAALVISEVLDKHGMMVWEASRLTSRLWRAVNQIGADRGERTTSGAPGPRVCVDGTPGTMIKGRDISHTGVYAVPIYSP